MKKITLLILGLLSLFSLIGTSCDGLDPSPSEELTVFSLPFSFVK